MRVYIILRKGPERGADFHIAFVGTNDKLALTTADKLRKEGHIAQIHSYPIDAAPRQHAHIHRTMAGRDAEQGQCLTCGAVPALGEQCTCQHKG